MKIKFEVENDFCKTKCKHSEEVFGETSGVAVGSLACRRRCKHFVSLDKENMEVECNFKEGKWKWKKK